MSNSLQIGSMKCLTIHGLICLIPLEDCRNGEVMLLQKDSKIKQIYQPFSSLLQRNYTLMNGVLRGLIMFFSMNIIRVSELCLIQTDLYIILG